MSETQHIETTLFELEKNRPARICGFDCAHEDTQTRLREIGFAEGDLVEIMHVGLFGRSPLNIRLHGTSIAMRPSEAQMIKVIPADLHRPMAADDNIVIDQEIEFPCCNACGDESA